MILTKHLYASHNSVHMGPYGPNVRNIEKSYVEPGWNIQRSFGRGKQLLGIRINAKPLPNNK